MKQLPTRHRTGPDGPGAERRATPQARSILHSSFFILHSSFFIACLLAGTVRAEGPSGGLPADTEAMLGDLRRKVSRHAEAAELLSRAQALSAEGEALEKQGDRASAEALYAQARDAILAVEEDVFYDPAVHAYFLQLAREIAPPREARAAGRDSTGALPLAMNEQVRSYVRYYRGRGRAGVRIAFDRLSRYEAMMRKIFREEGVPEDLIFVGLVESAYNPYARSPAGAGGIWQFIPATAVRYGLRRDGALDERYDPEKSTRAAARYLRDLFRLFENWDLALASYNAGEHRVMRIVRATGIRDFWEMRRRGLLPRETANYVPAVLAAIEVGAPEFPHRSRASEAAWQHGQRPGEERGASR